MSINGINSVVISDSEQAPEIHQAHDALIGAYIGSGMLYSGTIEYSGQILEAAKNLSGTQSKALLSRFNGRAKRLEELNGEKGIREQQVAIVFRAVFHDDTILPESPVILFPRIPFASNNNKADPISAPSQIPSAKSSSLATEQDAAWALNLATQSLAEFMVHRNIDDLRRVSAILVEIPPSKAREEALRSIDSAISAWSLRPDIPQKKPIAEDRNGEFVDDGLPGSLKISQEAIAGPGIDSECPFTGIALRALEEFGKSRDIGVLEAARTELQEIVEDNLTNPIDIEAAETAIDQLGDAIADAMTGDFPS